MQNNQSKQVAHGALMVALFTILYLITLYVPLLNLAAFLFAPLPIAWYSFKYDRKNSFIVIAISIVLSILYGPLVLLPISILLVVAGYLIGNAVKNKQSKVSILIITSMGVLASIVFMYVYILVMFGKNIIQSGTELLKQSYIDAANMNKDLNLSEDKIEELFDVSATLIPASIIITSIFIALLFVSIILPMLKKLKIDVPAFSKFSSLRLPKAVIWYYLAVLLISLIFNPAAHTTLYVIIMNFMLILWFLLTLQGIAFLFFVIEEKKLPKFLKIIVVVISIPLYNFVLLLGVFDLAFKIRQYISEKKTK